MTVLSFKQYTDFIEEGAFAFDSYKLVAKPTKGAKYTYEVIIKGVTYKYDLSSDKANAEFNKLVLHKPGMAINILKANSEKCYKLSGKKWETIECYGNKK